MHSEQIENATEAMLRTIEQTNKDLQTMLLKEMILIGHRIEQDMKRYLAITQQPWYAQAIENYLNDLRQEGEKYGPKADQVQ